MSSSHRLTTHEINSGLGSPLPSLATFSYGKARSISDVDFLSSNPVIRRGMYDVFGMDSNFSFPLNALRTPRTIREQAAKAPASTPSDSLHAKQKRRKSSRRSSAERLAPLGSTSSADIKASEGRVKDAGKKAAKNKLNDAPAQGPVVVPASRKMDSGYLLSDEEKRAKRQQIAQHQRDRGEKVGKSLQSLGTAPINASNDILQTVVESATIARYGTTSNSNGGIDGAAEAAHDELNGVYDNYFGVQARKSFHESFRQAKIALSKYPNDTELPDFLQTPRGLYLREVTKADLLPLPLVLRKESNPKGVYLGNKGLGDKRVLPIISMIEKLPAVETLDLSDNRLTDDSLMPLSLKLRGMPSITHLDLSFNKIDDSSETIMEYLRSDICQLRVLVLNGADVDDGESVNLFLAIAENKSVQSLSLGRNLIGNAELDSIVDPDLVTGGMAIGDMLRTNTTLTELDLSWNSIRLKSAEAIGKALMDNSTLKVLKLAYNTFGDMGTQLIGSSLKVNKCLRYLDLSCNSINPKASLVLANGLFDNTKLEYLNIDGNILGAVGAQAFVAAIQRSTFGDDGRQLRISFNNCDCKKYVADLFNASNPAGTWKVDLEEPYGQMVIEECIFLANHRAGCHVKSLSHDGREVTLVEAVTDGRRKFDLQEFFLNSRRTAEDLIHGNFESASSCLKKLLAQFDFSMVDATRMEVLKCARTVWYNKKAVNSEQESSEQEELSGVLLFEVFHALFVINDVDHDQTMNVNELRETLASLGKPNMDIAYLKRLMADHDKDDSGYIDANEFAMIMVDEFCQTDLPRGVLVNKATNKPYVIPNSGRAVIEMIYESDAPSSEDVGEDDGIENIIKAIKEAKTVDHKEIIFEQATSSPYFYLTADQGQVLFDEVQGLSKSALDIIACILPQLVNDEHVNRFIDSNLTTLGKMALRVRLGQLYNCYVGIATGHYNVDLRYHEQVQGVKRLSALAAAESKFNKYINLDTSQKGNHTNFRNEIYGASIIKLSGAWLAACPTNGVLKFDYVSTTRPREGTRPISDNRFNNLMTKMNFAGMADRIAEIRRQEEMGQSYDSRSRTASDVRDQVEDFQIDGGVEMMTIHHEDEVDLETSEVITGDTDNHIEESSTVSDEVVPLDETAGAMLPVEQEAQQPVDAYSDKPMSIVSRPESPEGTRSRTISTGTPITYARAITSKPSTTQKYADVIDPPLTVVHVREHFHEYLNTCHHYHDIMPKERQRDVSRQNYDPNKVPTTPDDLSSGPPPPRDHMPLFYPIAYRALLELEVQLPGLYLSVEQLKTILQYFPIEAYCRVQLIQSVFSRIVDLDDFHKIFDEVLTEDERWEVLHRLGVLNVFCPMYPDRQYSLDLRRWDHREYCKILIQLADVEPGENWVDAKYRWGKYDDPVPGWVLPLSWLGSDEESNGDGGPRRYGWIQLRYRSVGFGCAPVIPTRKLLKKLTLSGMKRIL